MANEVEKFNTIAITDIEKINTIASANMENLNTLEFLAIVPVVATFTANPSEGYTGGASEKTQFTFSNVAIGSATSDRAVIVTIGVAAGTASGVTFGAMTIGGVTATKHGSTADGFTGAPGMAVYSASVPSGTTATIVINFPVKNHTPGLSVYSTVGPISLHEAVKLDSDTSGSAALSFAPDVPAGGFVVEHTYDFATSTYTTSEVTEHYDRVIVSNRGDTAGSKHYDDAASPTITVDPSGSGATGGIVAVFAPG
jgi:hypothetical protein